MKRTDSQGLFVAHLFQPKERFFVLFAVLVWFSSCTRAELVPIPTPFVPTTAPLSCADLDSAWTEGNWQRALQVLTSLENSKSSCGIESLTSKRYAVHINYATHLESENERDAAIEHYRAALALDGRRQEALRALQRLNALPAPTRAPCAPQTLAPYRVSTNGKPFARADADKLLLGDEPLRVRGVNYYPRNAPWQDFLGEGKLAEIETEFDLIAARGFNTLRIFLWYDALFQCEPERALPNAAAFEKLDSIVRLAAERDLFLIVTLNDLPDFYFRPIYQDFARYDAQTKFIVARYRDEPMILMWDMRNEGDIDYGVSGAGMSNTTRENVLKWLQHVTQLVRASDSNHLLTAGWLAQAVETAPYVDVLSLHHWSTDAGLRERIASVRAETAKPLLIQELGMSSLGGNEDAQRQNVPRMIRVAEENGLAGWLIWTAFDFYALPDEMASPEHRFGIWRNDLSPKPVLKELPLPTRSP